LATSTSTQVEFLATFSDTASNNFRTFSWIFC